MKTLTTTTQCIECERVFDLSNEDDAAELFYGHDCEKPPARPNVHQLFDREGGNGECCYCDAPATHWSGGSSGRQNHVGHRVWGHNVCADSQCQDAAYRYDPLPDRRAAEDIPCDCGDYDDCPECGEYRDEILAWCIPAGLDPKRWL